MRLRYTLPALADLASILDYIADRSPQGAARIHARPAGDRDYFRAGAAYRVVAAHAVEGYVVFARD